MTDTKIWPKIMLEIEGREDGGIRVSSPNLLGLILSHPDKDAVFKDLPKIIPLILARGQYIP